MKIRRFVFVPLLSLCLGGVAQAQVTELADEKLREVLDRQPEAAQARFEARNPHVTLRFFGVEPGMTVMEALPGGGWYSKILIDYLGPDGKLIGANYPQDMWPLFGFFSDEQIAGMANWAQDWPAQAEGWVSDGADVEAFRFGDLPEAMEGTADVVLFIRALHNMARFEDQGEYLTKGVRNAWDILEPGGIVGVVQHEARPDMSDEFADGSHGYLKKAFVIERFEDAGFEFVAESDINENPADRPGPDDVVWRLPPTLMGSEEGSEARAAMEAIGESNRMTLKFRKPK